MNFNKIFEAVQGGGDQDIFELNLAKQECKCPVCGSQLPYAEAKDMSGTKVPTEKYCEECGVNIKLAYILGENLAKLNSEFGEEEVADTLAKVIEYDYE